MPSWPVVFLTFLSVAPNDYGCIFTSEPSSCPCNSFFKLFIDSVFPLCSFCSHYLLQNCFPSFTSVCWFVLMHSSPTCWLNFLLLFWNVQFCLYWLTLSQCPLSILSFANIFWFSNLSALSSWSFHPNISSCVFPSLTLSLVVPISFTVFCVLIRVGLGHLVRILPYILVYIFLVSQGQKTNVISISF